MDINPAEETRKAEEAKRIVEALRKTCKEEKLAVSDAVVEDPIGTVFRVERMSEEATHIAMVIYDPVMRKVVVQIAERKENESGADVLVDDVGAMVMRLPNCDGLRLELAIGKLTEEIKSSLFLVEYFDRDSGNGDGDKEPGEEPDDGDDEGDAENPEEDGSDEEEGGQRALS